MEGVEVSCLWNVRMTVCIHQKRLETVSHAPFLPLDSLNLAM